MEIRMKCIAYYVHRAACKFVGVRPPHSSEVEIHPITHRPKEQLKVPPSSFNPNQ